MKIPVGSNSQGGAGYHREEGRGICPSSAGPLLDNHHLARLGETSRLEPVEIHAAGQRRGAEGFSVHSHGAIDRADPGCRHPSYAPVAPKFPAQQVGQGRVLHQ